MHADATLLLAEMVKRAVLLATVLIDEDRMSVAEGATLDVLSGQTNGMSLQEERAKRQQFASRPVHLTAIFHGFGTGLGQALQFAVEFEVCGEFGQTVADFTQGGQRDIGLDGFVVPLFGQTRPMVPVPRGARGHGGVFGSSLGFVEAFPSGGSHALRRFRCQDTLLNEPLRMGFGNAGLVLDAFVQLGLGEGGLVALVVSVTPVAPHFNHHIGAKFLPVSQRQSGRKHTRFGIISIDVQDRGFHHLGQVGAVAARERVMGVGGEANLVVDDQVDRAAHVIAIELHHVEAFGHHALSGERGVAMDGHRHHADAIGIHPQPLFGADPTQNHRTDEFKVRGVGAQRKMNVLSRCGSPRVGVAQVVLHISAAFGEIFGPRFFKFRENLIV